MDLHLLIAIGLSCGVGVSLGLLGGGGSILAVPLLVYVARLDVHVAIGMSLAIVGATSLGGALVHAREGRVDLKAALVFGASGMVAAPLGAWASQAAAPQVLLLLFAGLMVAVGGLMLRGRRGERAEEAHPARPLAVLGAGLGVGALTGFLGVGGGFLIVPALTLLAGLSMHTAVGTSLLVIALNAAAGLAGHLRQGGIPPGLTAAFIGASLLGAFVGGRLSARVKPAPLRRAFAVFVILIGVALLVANLRPA
jgi:uncharacterized membrane protein YfcA